MEHQLWGLLQQHLRRLTTVFNPHHRYSDLDVVRVYLWAVLHDRPTRWACDKHNGPPYARRVPRPSESRMSRRLRTPAVVDLLRQLEDAVLRPDGPPPILHWVDGKPLPIGGCSKDRQAGYGRSAGGKAKGYKLHALVGSDGSVPAWRIAPMNTDERVMARRMLRQAAVAGYVVADGNYDDNNLHDVCLSRQDVQLVTARRYKQAQGVGHRQQSPSRMRSLALIGDPVSEFGRDLLRGRSAIERYFGQLTTFGGGLQPLPAWVRTHRRVHRWVQAKLILNALRIRLRQTTCAA